MSPYPILLTSGFGFLYLGALVALTEAKRRRKWLLLYGEVMTLAGIVSLIYVAIFYFRLIPYVQTAFASIVKQFDPFVPYAGLFTLVCIGFSSFWLKRRQLLYYARAEIVFAALSCLVAATRARDHVKAGHELGIDVLTVLVGVVYLTVRGFDNYSKAIDEGNPAAASREVEPGLQRTKSPALEST